jgi:hypothetical protein
MDDFDLVSTCRETLACMMVLKRFGLQEHAAPQIKRLQCFNEMAIWLCATPTWTLFGLPELVAVYWMETPPSQSVMPGLFPLKIQLENVFGPLLQIRPRIIAALQKMELWF